MVALFAFIAGIVLKLPAWYFVIGFLCLVIDGTTISQQRRK